MKKRKKQLLLAAQFYQSYQYLPAEQESIFTDKICPKCQENNHLHINCLEDLDVYSYDYPHRLILKAECLECEWEDTFLDRARLSKDYDSGEVGDVIDEDFDDNY